MSNKEYEQAFPTRDDNYDSKYSGPGMTLRDYFAAKAMQALITGAMSDGTSFNTKSGDHDAAAEVAYLIADAMLRVREG